MAYLNVHIRIFREIAEYISLVSELNNFSSSGGTCQQSFHTSMLILRKIHNFVVEK